MILLMDLGWLEEDDRDRKHLFQLLFYVFKNHKLCNQVE